MRCSGRNRMLVHYANYDKTTVTKDEWGNETGEGVTYTDPQPLYVHVSAAKNTDTVSMFGVNIDYDRILVFASRLVPFNEHSVFWIDTNPMTDHYDYIVKRVAKSPNGTTVAIKRVDVS